MIERGVGGLWVDVGGGHIHPHLSTHNLFYNFIGEAQLWAGPTTMCRLWKTYYQTQR
jgi:hypothetical protein